MIRIDSRRYRSTSLVAVTIQGFFREVGADAPKGRIQRLLQPPVTYLSQLLIAFQLQRLRSF